MLSIKTRSSLSPTGKKETQNTGVQNTASCIQETPYFNTYLGKKLYCLVQKACLHFFWHRQEISSTVEDTQQSEPVTLWGGEQTDTGAEAALLMDDRGSKPDCSFV